MLYVILKSIIGLIFKLFFHFEVKGREYIPKKGGFLLASNHTSNLDPITLGVASPRKLNFMAKYDLFVNPFFSWLITSLGAFPLKRGEADFSGLKEALRQLKNGAALVLFPQGSRIIEEDYTAVQPGIGFLAFNSDVPIIPAFIKGTNLALPKGSRFIRPAKIKVCFGEPIFIERGCKPNYSEIAQNTISRIRNLSCK